MAFLAQNKAKLRKFLIITLDFEKNANRFAENWQKSQKIVIITSRPDEIVKKIAQSVAQTHFVKKIIHIPNRGKMLATFVVKKLPKIKQSPNGRKFAQAGHPGFNGQI
jgi:phosphoserine phosphatase